MQAATSKWLAAHQQARCPEEGSPCSGRHLRSWSQVSHDGSVIYRGNSLGETDKPEQVSPAILANFLCGVVCMHCSQPALHSS